MLSKKQIKKIFKVKDLKILKSLGQNFLIDENVLNEIIQAAELNKNDIVVEIGPGLGVLTRELSKRCKRVITVEKDKKLAELLKKELNNLLSSDKEELRGIAVKIPNPKLPITNYQLSIPNTEIVNDDILKINLEELIEKHIPDGKYKLVSNIPYYITSPIIKLFLESKVQPELMVLLIQKEVAERICAKKGKLSVLALSVQVYGEPEIIGYVDKSSFYPEPKVNSAILRIKNIKRDFLDNYYKKLFRIVKIGFSSKRKKLVNNLSAGLRINKTHVGKILLEAKINPNARAQELDLEEWKILVKLIYR